MRVGSMGYDSGDSVKEKYNLLDPPRPISMARMARTKPSISVDNSL
jgi:hypothetical protein